jgi:RNA polymerase sigma factor (TIGR02999 family)
MTQVTTLLSALAGGRTDAFDELYQLLYAELHQLAHARVRRSGNLTLLDTTSLVHEAYLRFESANAISFRDRHAFLAYAARVMRSIVVDAVRRRQNERHGGHAVHLEFDETTTVSSTDAHDREILRVHESLEELAAIDERLVRVVEMRYFAGMTETEIAMALGLAARTVARDWEKARLFLHATLR